MRADEPMRVVVAVTGASGAILALHTVRLLADAGAAVHLVVTASGRRVVLHEAGADALAVLHACAAVVHDDANIGAAIASGSFRTHGMIVVPCSIRTLSAIASGITGSLAVRAADVHLKERRRLVLMVRETPLHLGHLRSMVAVTEMGGIVMPPVPAFYHQPAHSAAAASQLAAHAIDLLGLPIGALAAPWTGGEQSG